jgi:hypothetical protein
MLLPILASGQIYVDSYKFAAPAADLLLDTYSGADIAHSLRLLDKDYTGDCITVRRKSDEALDTFGFVNNYLDTTALKSFCGTGASDTCWVRIWFDQSGNARNASQTTNANQPIILASGAIHRDGGDVAILFDGSNDFLSITSFTPSSTSNFSPMVGSRRASASRLLFYGGGDNSWLLTLWVDNKFYFQGKSTQYFASTNTDTALGPLLISGQNSSGTMSVFKNGSSVAGSSINLTLTISVTGIGRYASVNPLYVNGSLKEGVIWSSDQSSNRTGIESNINSFYSIY